MISILDTTCFYILRFFQILLRFIERLFRIEVDNFKIAKILGIFMIVSAGIGQWYYSHTQIPFVIKFGEIGASSILIFLLIFYIETVKKNLYPELKMDKIIPIVRVFLGLSLFFFVISSFQISLIINKFTKTGVISVYTKGFVFSEIQFFVFFLSINFASAFSQNKDRLSKNE